MRVLKRDVLVCSLLLALLEVEDGVLGDEGALGVVALRRAGLRVGNDQAELDQLDPLVLLVLDRHPAFLQVIAPGPVAGLALDADHLWRLLQTHESAGLAVSRRVTRQAFLVVRVVLLRIDVHLLFRVRMGARFEQLEGVRHLGRFPGLKLFEMAKFAFLGAHVRGGLQAGSGTPCEADRENDRAPCDSHRKNTPFSGEGSQSETDTRLIGEAVPTRPAPSSRRSRGREAPKARRLRNGARGLDAFPSCPAFAARGSTCVGRSVPWILPPSPSAAEDRSPPLPI